MDASLYLDLRDAVSSAGHQHEIDWAQSVGRPKTAEDERRSEVMGYYLVFVVGMAVGAGLYQLIEICLARWTEGR